MNKIKEILLSNLNGNLLDIAKKADSDKNEKLTGSEISIFLMECEDKGIVYEDNNPSNKNEFQYFIKPVKKFWEKHDVNSEAYGNYKIVTKETYGEKIKIYDSNEGNEFDTEIRTKIAEDQNGNTRVNYSKTHFRCNKLYIQESSFEYNVADLENYIISKASKKGNKITYFSDIPKVRLLPENKRTTQEKELLEEFDNLIKYVTEIGTEYGVDPKQIIAIIQEESEFDGLGKKRKVSTDSGKGYMQLTSSVHDDILGLDDGGTYGNIKLNIYGVEVIELFESRGFKIQEVQTNEEKKKLSRKIMNYLIKNQDPEFNIRLGTLKLRKELNSANGDFRQAAYKYNGNKAIDKFDKRPVREGYKNRTSETLAQLSKNCLTDSTYVYKIKNIAT